MSERQACCVPFCRRTHKPDGHEAWICGPHWRGTPARAKAVVRKAARAYRRRFGNNAPWDYPAGSPDRLAAVEAYHAWRDAWEACKAAAIEAAAGL